MSDFLGSLERQYGIANQPFAEYAVDRLAVSVQNVSHLCSVVDEAETLELARITDGLHQLNAILSSLLNLWQSYEESTASMEDAAYSTPLEQTAQRGRPRFRITRDQLDYLRSLSFSWTEIASLLGVSRMTIYRRRVECGLLHEQRDVLSDAELDAMILDFRRDLPYSGQTMILGRLRGMGFYTTRVRVRESIRRVDPLNTPLRWGGGLHHRRPYSVPGPNSLWHLGNCNVSCSVLRIQYIFVYSSCIYHFTGVVYCFLSPDGHHKLVRWRFVTHGGIDGYSRLIVYLKCATNNKAATVHGEFMKAVHRFGLPSRIRTDYGTENLQVAQHMLRYRGLDRNSVITGNSTHNQRIERLWRDLHQSVTKMYYRLFYHLENQLSLDPLNELHLFALHYVYLPRINRSLEMFQEAWNHHGLRTMHNASPHQLYTAGTLRLQQSNIQALDFFEDVDNAYGIDENVTWAPNAETTVNVPGTRVNVAPETYALLQAQIDPLAESDNFGIELFESAVRLLQAILQ